MLVEILSVLIITIAAVVGMINFKDYINRSEALNAMRELGQIILEYKQRNHKVPPQSLVIKRRGQLKGGVRLSDLRYRGLWIGLDADPNEILAYAEKSYPSSFLNDGYIVLQLDGTVRWMGKKEFDQLLAQQQTELEMEMTGP